MTTTIDGHLEVDHDRGVIYFHQSQLEGNPPTMLRICSLGKLPVSAKFIDITHMTGLHCET